MDISTDIGGKWEELGVALGLDYSVVENVVSNAKDKRDHMKSFYVLREWKQRNAYKATYETLAAALEEIGLKSCAQKHCYADREH